MIDGIIGIIFGILIGCFGTIFALSMAKSASDRDDKVRHKIHSEGTKLNKDIKCSTNKMTGEISSYEISGITNNKPLYMRMEDIVCIWRKGGKQE